MQTQLASFTLDHERRRFYHTEQNQIRVGAHNELGRVRRRLDIVHDVLEQLDLQKVSWCNSVCVWVQSSIF